MTPSLFHLLMAAYLAQDDDEEDWVDVELREAECGCAGGCALCAI